MNFQQAVQSGFKNYGTFAGRAARSEYWFWTLFCIIAGIVTSILDVAVFGADLKHNDLSPLNLIFSIITLLPSIAVTARRLHDVNRSGWWILLWLIPVIGWIILLIWTCTKGTTGDNRFGADPLA